MLSCHDRISYLHLSYSHIGIFCILILPKVHPLTSTRRRCRIFSTTMLCGTEELVAIRHRPLPTTTNQFPTTTSTVLIFRSTQLTVVLRLEHSSSWDPVVGLPLDTCPPPPTTTSSTPPPTSAAGTFLLSPKNRADMVTYSALVKVGCIVIVLGLPHIIHTRRIHCRRHHISQEQLLASFGLIPKAHMHRWPLRPCPRLLV